MAGSVGDCLLRKGLLKMIEYTIIRSRRKTMCLQVKADGQVVVRAPLRMTKQQIQEFVQKHESWILKKQDLAWKNSRRPVITDQERREGMEAARRYIPQRVAYLSLIHI